MSAVLAVFGGNFEAAAKRLSADVINFSAKGSSVSKGESLKDTALTLQAMGADAVVIRHPASGAPHRLSSWVDGSVINAGDGTHEHPTQALLDAYTMRSRLGKLDGLNVAIVGDEAEFGSDPFVPAGEQLQELIEMEPFQAGYQAAVWDGAGAPAATMATGGAAMMLMGQWAPGTMNANSPDGNGLGDSLGWFPFPEVDGGDGDPTDGFGGGNGLAVGADAPPEAIEFLEYISTPDIADRWGETNSGILPVVVGSEDSVTDENLTSVLDARAEADAVQLYLDQAYDPAFGESINDAVEQLFAGQASPEDVTQMIADAAGG